MGPACIHMVPFFIFLFAPVTQTSCVHRCVGVQKQSEFKATWDVRTNLHVNNRCLLLALSALLGFSFGPPGGKGLGTPVMD